MVFIVTWAWLALALRRDQYHARAKEQHAKLVAAGRLYVTTDYVLGELITQLYRSLSASEAAEFVAAVFAAIEAGTYRLEQISADRFASAWRLRQQYADKPSISFTEFTLFVVMRELGIVEAFTGDAHFEQVNLGLRRLP
jgi:uncharacterized protein